MNLEEQRYLAYRERADKTIESFQETLDEASEQLARDEDISVPILDTTEVRCLRVTLGSGFSVILFFDGDGGVIEGFYSYAESSFPRVLTPIKWADELQQVCDIYGLDGWDWSAKR